MGYGGTNTNKLSKHNLVLSGIQQGKPLSLPRKAVIELANGCNLKCDFCWSHSPLLEKAPTPEWSSHILSKEKIFSYVDELSTNANFEFIELCAVGDPLYHPNIWEIIEYIKRKKITLRISTNATLINPVRMQRFLEIGVDQLNINLSASNREEYASIHNVSPKIFDTLITNLMYLKEQKIKRSLNKPITRFVNVITPKNIFSIGDLLHLGANLGADSILFRPVWNHKEFLRQISYSEEIIKGALIEKENHIQQANNLKITHDLELFYSELERKITTNTPEYKPLYDNPPCTVAYHFSVLGVNGMLRYCCHSEKEIEPYTNLKTQWYGEKYQEFRKNWRENFIQNKPICEGCAHAEEHLKYLKKFNEANINRSDLIKN